MTSAEGRIDGDALSDDDPHSSSTSANRWLVTAAVFVVFMSYSAICRPVPSVNEPHYLTKAKHYWQPAWCAGDFFLESSNPHLVFYQTIGALTQWLTLEQSAWAGRVIALALLAWGWTRLTSRFLLRRWGPLAAACLFLLLQALGNLSGEWLVGGVESKVFAYAFAFAGIASLIDGRPIPAGVWLGIAVSFHPVVGGWCMIALVMAGMLRFFAEGRSAANRSQWRPLPWMIGGSLFVLFAMPGVIPALQLLGEVNSEAAAIADRLQVGQRLRHHLDPMWFSVDAYRYYALLGIVWLLLRPHIPTMPARRLFTAFVAASVVIALIGVIVGWGPRPIEEMPLSELRVWLLTFYPFRLADILVPMLAAVSIVDALAVWASGQHTIWRRWGPEIAAGAAIGIALCLPNADRTPSRMSLGKEIRWRAACEWIRTQSPPDALLYATNEDWAVKWFCHRAEYVNYKDCPQETGGIISWARRLKTLQQWHRATFRDLRCTEEELHQLHQATGITHLLVSRLGPVEVAPAYENGSFRVYAIGD